MKIWKKILKACITRSCMNYRVVTEGYDLDIRVWYPYGMTMVGSAFHETICEVINGLKGKGSEIPDSLLENIEVQDLELLHKGTQVTVRCHDGDDYEAFRVVGKTLKYRLQKKGWKF